MKKVMVGSPVCQDPEILKEFLVSLEELIKEDIQVSYCFVDDNKIEESKNLLREFQDNNEEVNILDVDLGWLNNLNYQCDENTHLWNESLVDKVIAFKNKIIELFLKSNNDYLFFIDSDIILDKRTLLSLIEADKDIIANIFWTKWNNGAREEPQVWVKDFYTFYEGNDDVGGHKTAAFFNMLKKPGVYKVGGLGACTLIKRAPLEAGVNFSKIKNISFWGEDRAFCIRAAVLGFDLFVDTRQPAYHIYRKSNLSGISDFKKGCDEKLIEWTKSIVLSVLSNMETYDYRENKNDTWKNYIIEESSKEINELVEDFNEKKKLSHSINTVSLDGYSGDIINNSSIGVKAKLKHRGYKDWKSFEEVYIYHIVLEEVSLRNWKIKSLSRTLDSSFRSLNIIRSSSLDSKLTLSMIVKDEENRYLEKALMEHKKYIDSAVIIDDGSSDRTKEIVKDILGGCNLTLIENEDSKFSQEVYLRKQQWEETVKTNPEWILSLDADEIFENSFASGIKNLINSDLDMDGYSFRLYDFWDEKHYREDRLWHAHHLYRILLVRYQENYEYTWNNTPQHCGRLPNNCYGLNNALSNYRLKHFGWAKEEDRIKKFNRYLELDPSGIYGSLEQYHSIVDSTPNLIKWEE